MSEQDRRRYFRINDWVGLSYCTQVAQNVEYCGDADNVQISATQILDVTEKELLGALSLLWLSNPQAANVIGLINKKLDFVISEMEFDYLQAGVLQHELTRVNISACGMAFECDEQFDAGQVLELNLLLKPVKTKLKLQGCVTACQRSESGSKKAYMLRVDFVGIDTAVREELIQHIVRRQSMQLSEQRQQPAQ